MGTHRSPGEPFRRDAIISLSGLCLLFCCSPVACDEAAKTQTDPQNGERAATGHTRPEVKADEYLKIPPDYVEDIAPRHRFDATQNFLKPRFVRPGKVYASIHDVNTPRRYDLLQQAVAPGIVTIDGKRTDLILRWELSFTFSARTVMRSGGQQYDVTFAEEPDPWVTYTLLSRSDDGKERVLVPSTSPGIHPETVPLVLGNKRSHSYDGTGAAPLSFVLQDVPSALTDASPSGFYHGDTETAYFLFGWQLAPALGQVYAEKIAPWERERQQRTLTAMLSRYITHTTHANPKDLLSGWERRVPDWEYVPGEGFAYVSVQYFVRADDAVCAVPTSASTWCAFIPEGQEEIREMELSPLIARRTARYQDSMADWLRPLLGTDLLQRATSHFGDSTSKETTPRRE